MKLKSSLAHNLLIFLILLLCMLVISYLSIPVLPASFIAPVVRFLHGSRENFFSHLKVSLKYTYYGINTYFLMVYFKTQMWFCRNVWGWEKKFSYLKVLYMHLEITYRVPGTLVKEPVNRNFILKI